MNFIRLAPDFVWPVLVSGDNLRPVGSSATKEKRHFVDLSCHDRESSFVTTSTTDFGFGNLVPEKLGLVHDS